MAADRLPHSITFLTTLKYEHLVSTLGKPVVAVLGLRNLETPVGGDVLDSVPLVDVLSEHVLVGGGSSLSRGDDGRGEEKLPDSEPSHAVLVDHLVLVAHPVSVPAPQSGGVVDTNVVDGNGLKASALHLVEEEGQRSGGVGTGENVLVHEQTPVEILVLPVLSQTGVLQHKGSVVLKHVVDLGAERAEVLDANVLHHLQRNDLVVLLGSALGQGDVSVVHAQNSGLGGGHAVLGQVLVAVGSLVLAQSDSGHVDAVLLGGKSSQSSPAAANVENLLALLESGLLTHNSKLVVLHLLKGLLLVDIGNDTGGVDHSGAQEPGVEVVASVVVLSDLLLVLVLGVEDDLGNHGQQEELEQTPGEVEGHEVVSVLENVERVASHRHLVVKVQLVESLVGDLVGAGVLLGKNGVVELEVVLHGSAGELAVGVDSGRDGRDHGPEGDQQRQAGDQEEEEVGPHGAADLVVDEEGDAEEDGEQQAVGEVSGAGAFSGQRSILDTGVLC